MDIDFSNISLEDDSGYLPGATSLLESVDKKVLVVLNDERILVGFLRSIDQFGNIVLHRTVERIFIDKCYGDVPLGMLCILGTSISMIGEVDPHRVERITLCQLSSKEILELQKKSQTRNRKIAVE
ncbi:hypothetical protein SNEBB_005616 [Seison nebaliae]|nr:hypothetical protein SNEBB_005616 [Seison nebaliae]